MKRRRFLQSTSVALGITRLSRAEVKPSERIRVGQIGTKHAHASGQIKTCRQLNDIYEFVGVVEPDNQRRRQLENDSAYRGVSWLTEERLLNTPGLQVVAVETAVKDLIATAQRCVDAGLHIHLDKPAGESLPALQRLHDAAARKSVTIQMGYMFRYNPAFRFVFDAVAKGWLGQIFEVDGVISKTVNEASRRELLKYRGGSMFELGCHLIDPLLHVMGEPDDVKPFNRQTRPERDSLLDNTLAVFEYARATATIRSALVEVDGVRRRQFVICGDEGTITIRPLEPPQLELTLARDRGRVTRGSTVVHLPASPGRYHGAWTDLASVIRGEKEHKFSHGHDLAVQRAVLAASGYHPWSNHR